MGSFDAEQQAAAVKLQAMQRGKQARKHLPKAAIKPTAVTTVKYTLDHDAEQELAAIKLQAMQRGKKVRGSVPVRFPSTPIDPHRPPETSDPPRPDPS